MTQAREKMTAAEEAALRQAQILSGAEQQQRAPPLSTTNDHSLPLMDWTGGDGGGGGAPYGSLIAPGCG